MSDFVPDILALVGLIMLGFGVGLYSVPCALVAVGGLLMLLGLSMAKRGHYVSK